MKQITVFALIFSLISVCYHAEEVDANSAWDLLYTLKSDMNGIQIKDPTALYVDTSTDRYYIIDSGSNRVFSFNKKGEPLNSFNAGGQLSNPVGMVKQKDGQLIIIEKGKTGLTQIDLKGHQVKNLAVQNSKGIITPQRIKTNKSNLFLLDKVSGSVFGLDENFAITTQMLCDNCEAGYVDFEFVKDEIYALTGLESQIHIFSKDGSLKDTVTFEPKIDFPVSFAISADSKFYILERHKHKVLVYGKDGRFLYDFLKHGEKQGNLYYPIDINFDPWGRLVIVDENNGRANIYSR